VPYRRQWAGHLDALERHLGTMGSDESAGLS
jgi:hypothetical protein